MKLSKLVGDRFKEQPSDCVINSHILTIRGGYIKYVANGIFSLYPPMRRITKKIEKIIREEMDAIDGQEVLLPVVLPAALWQESGRFESIGKELLRFEDRNNSQLVLGMTHEEAAVQLVKEFGQTYAKYPFMIYQIQTKFRDEARPRAGLIRVREFTMKDAYSFHTSQEDLERYYDKCYHAYNRIFQRVGVPEVIAVKSDSGMMGGNISHEYMLLTEAGEDSIVICNNCGYRANMEAAENCVDNSNVSCISTSVLEKVYTPNCRTIEDVASYLKCPIESTCKAVVYQKNSSDEYIIVFLRGDYEVNETKLTNLLGEKIHPADILPESGIIEGFIGPYQLKKNYTVIYDTSLKGISSLVCGANEQNYHYIGLNIFRDCGDVRYSDISKIKTGGICPCCGKKKITIKRGIEVGNIFQLGTKYSKSMNMTYSDIDGTIKNPIMGCYGIGIGRLASAICEAKHDANGPLWPISIAPWHVHLCCMRVDQKVCKEASDRLYGSLLDAGIEVLYDDRDIRAGAMFADADLLGIPLRVVVGPKNLKNGQIELLTRDKQISKLINLDEAVSEIKNIIQKLQEELDSCVEAHS